MQLQFDTRRIPQLFVRFNISAPKPEAKTRKLFFALLVTFKINKEKLHKQTDSLKQASVRQFPDRINHKLCLF